MVRVETANCAETITGRASGAVLQSGLVVTVAHAFDVRASLHIRNAQGKAVPARLLYLDDERDLALLEPDDLIAGSEPDFLTARDRDAMLELADPTPGPIKFLTYADLEAGPQVRDGSISRLATVTLDGVGLRSAIRLAASIEPGDSGGPVIQDGRLVGMIFATTRNVDLGWAIAAEEIEDAIARLERDGPNAEQLIC